MKTEYFEPIIIKAAPDMLYLLAAAAAIGVIITIAKVQK